MTKKGAQIIIESLSLRIFDIDDTIERLLKEKEHHRARIRELEHVEDHNGTENREQETNPFRGGSPR